MVGLILKVKGRYGMNCEKCNVKMNRRKNYPYTAHKQNSHLFNYYLCPECGFNSAVLKSTLTDLSRKITDKIVDKNRNSNHER